MYEPPNLFRGLFRRSDYCEETVIKGEAQELRHGLYRVYWKSGGSSLAAVGSMCNGSRWVAPTNWVSDQGRGSIPGAYGKIWEDIERVELLFR